MIVMVFGSHMFVGCLCIMIFGCFGYGRKCWCHMFLRCFDYGRKHWCHMLLGCFDYCIMYWRHIFVGCFDYNHVVVDGMGYVLDFVVGCVTCIDYGFGCLWVDNFVG